MRRQLEAIRRELGQLSDAGEGEQGDYRTRIESIELPEAVRHAVERELDKLERTSEQNPEQGWIRGWLDTVQPISAFRRSNGEYVILIEDDYKSKVVMYRWRP